MHNKQEGQRGEYMAKSVASYQSIALDIAKRIVNDEFPIGTRLSGRTLLASQYRISPETIRKAIGILKENNVVAVSQGKEITVLSTQQAHLFIEHRKEMLSAYSLKQELEILMKKKENNDRQFRKIVTEIMCYSDKLKNIAPYNPVEIRILQDWRVVGNSLKEIDLWSNTGATLVAIRRGTEIIISPGPNEILQGEDRIIVVGASDVLQTVIDFFSTLQRQ